jgi:uncharacterized protein with NRDE domain
MCVAAFDWQPGTPRPLRLISNRDEFFARPTTGMAWWQHAQQPVLSGRDEQAGGTWLAISGKGRVALLTNFRRGLAEPPRPRSRGLLPLAWLQAASPEPWAQGLDAADYAPFNLVGIDLVQGAAWWVHGDGHAVRVAPVPAGLHGLSNGLLNEPWPKTRRLMQALQEAADLPGALPALLDSRPAETHELPRTGLDAARERALSAVFIEPDPQAPADRLYGTRASTVIVADLADGGLAWQASEWQHLPGRPGHRRQDYRFKTRP